MRRKKNVADRKIIQKRIKKIRKESWIIILEEFSFPLVSGPLSSHEVNGVRKEKERLTAITSGSQKS